MPRLLRRLLVLTAALGAVAAFAANGALAVAPTCPPSAPAMPRSISSSHFLVGYTDDKASGDYITEVQAGTVLSALERAYGNYRATGFPTTYPGLSGKTEFYVMDLTALGYSALYDYGCVVVDKAAVTGASMDYTLGVDVFQQMAYTIINDQAGPSEPSWIMNGPGSWASWRMLGYPASSIAGIGPFDMPLDCYSAGDKFNCSKDGYENLGGSRWPFYEYLAEKFGPLFMIDLFTSLSADPSHNGLAALQTTLIAKGTTLGAEYGAYAAKLLAGGWSASTLNAATIPVFGEPINTGTSTGAIPTRSIGINHLATKFIEIDRGDGSADHPCFAATLALNVQIPAGVTSQPTFYWNGGGSTPVALSVSGQTATATVPWDTCKWASKGYLALPNTGLVDGTSFVVSGTLTVDLSTPASAVLPPAPSAPFGPVVDAGSVSLVPGLSVFGPATLKLASDAKQLRLAVRSSGDGSVRASIGSTTLGTLTVEAGGNDLRFTIPASFLQSLPAGSILTLTPLAPNGTAGTAVTRTISVTTVTQALKHASLKKKSAKKASQKKQRRVRAK